LDEVVDHIEFEALGEVPHVVGDAYDVGGALGIHRVLDGAATAAAGTAGPGHPAECQVYADNLAARVDPARGSDGGVDPATHRCQNFHAYQSKRDTCAHPARTKTKENLPAIRPFLPRRMLSGRFSFVLVALLG